MLQNFEVKDGFMVFLLIGVTAFSAQQIRLMFIDNKGDRRVTSSITMAILSSLGISILFYTNEVIDLINHSLSTLRISIFLAGGIVGATIWLLRLLPKVGDFFYVLLLSLSWIYSIYERFFGDELTMNFMLSFLTSSFFFLGISNMLLPEKNNPTKKET